MDTPYSFQRLAAAAPALLFTPTHAHTHMLFWLNINKELMARVRWLEYLRIFLTFKQRGRKKCVCYPSKVWVSHQPGFKSLARHGDTLEIPGTVEA